MKINYINQDFIMGLIEDELKEAQSMVDSGDWDLMPSGNAIIEVLQRLKSNIEEMDKFNET